MKVTLNNSGELLITAEVSQDFFDLGQLTYDLKDQGILHDITAFNVAPSKDGGDRMKIGIQLKEH